MRTIEIMDTTLRDGEQMQNVSFNTEEKLSISKILLTELGVDRLEITSARVSSGEKESVLKITKWAKSAKLLDRLEILTMVDKNKSVDWAKSVGIKRINLLTKGSLKHCEGQLKKTPEQHFKDIKETVSYAINNKIEVNVYLEDYSHGIKNSPDYLYYMLDNLTTLPIKRIMLPDTLGILSPYETYEYLNQIVKRYPNVHFDYHPHNDYGLGVANCLAAAKAGAKGLHVTVNGLGERAGNASLDEVVVGLKDFFDIKLNINENQLYKASKIVEMFSGLRMARNKPIYGSNVFIQTAGIHADGDKKGNLYSNKLAPERFSRSREYALGKLAGKSSLDFNLKKLGIELDENEKKILLSKIIDLGDKKESITSEDLPYLISDIFETPRNIPFELIDWTVNTNHQLRPLAAVKCSYKNVVKEHSASGDGGYDAFMNSIKYILKEFKIQIPKLVDYIVTIPPGGKTDALVQARISWEVKENRKTRRYVTRGVNPDQLTAAIRATIKMINILVTKNIPIK